MLSRLLFAIAIKVKGMPTICWVLNAGLSLRMSSPGASDDLEGLVEA